MYLSGPMRGYPSLNRPAFDRAAQAMRVRGWVVWNPADEPDVDDPDCPLFLRAAMGQDIAWLLQSDAIAILPGWRSSAGAVTEVALSCVVSMPAYDAETLDDVTEDVREWWHSVLGRAK